MQMRVRIVTSAWNDLANGKYFYNEQGPGLGDYFFDSLFSDIDSLVLYGGVHRKLFGYHRMLSERFRYAIYYKTEGDDLVVVWRFLDCRMAPRKTRRSFL